MSGIIGQVGARSGIVGSGTDSTQLEYEEGLHTVTMTAGGLTYTGSDMTAQYIRIGQFVTVNGLLHPTGTSGSGGGSLQITMPFTPNTSLSGDGDVYLGTSFLILQGSTISGRICSYMSSSVMNWRTSSDDGTGHSNVLDSDVDTDFYIGFSITYRAA